MALAFAASTATCTVANAKDIFCPGEFFFGVNYWGSQAGNTMGSDPMVEHYGVRPHGHSRL